MLSGEAASLGSFSLEGGCGWILGQLNNPGKVWWLSQFCQPGPVESQICGWPQNFWVFRGVSTCPSFRDPWLLRKAPWARPSSTAQGNQIRFHTPALVSTPGFSRPSFSPPCAELCLFSPFLQDVCCFLLKAEFFFFFFHTQTSFLLISQLSLGFRMWLHLTKARRFQN